MSSLAALFDGALVAWQEGFAAARLAGKPRGSLVAVVLDESLTTDRFPEAFVGDEVQVRARLDAIDREIAAAVFGPPAPSELKPFAVALRRHESGGIESVTNELTFPEETTS